MILRVFSSRLLLSRSYGVLACLFNLQIFYWKQISWGALWMIFLFALLILGCDCWQDVITTFVSSSCDQCGFNKRVICINSQLLYKHLKIKRLSHFSLFFFFRLKLEFGSSRNFSWVSEPSKARHSYHVVVLLGPMVRWFYDTVCDLFSVASVSSICLFCQALCNHMLLKVLYK